VEVAFAKIMRSIALGALAVLFLGSGRETSAKGPVSALRSIARGLRPASLRAPRTVPAKAPVRLQWKSARTTKKSKKRLRRERSQHGARISAYCIGAEIDVEALSEATIAQDGRVWKGQAFDDTWHLSSPGISLSAADAADGAEDDGPSNIFIMPYGCVVFWKLRPDEEASFLELLAPFTHEPVDKVEYDSLTLAPTPHAHAAGGEGSCDEAGPVVDADAAPLAELAPVGSSPPSRKVSEEVVTLGSDTAAEKLAISFALAQSVKLSLLEEELDKQVSAIRHIPEQMSKRGHVRFSAREVNRMTGKLFIFRSEVNLYSDILDGQPSWFWDNEDFAPQYEATAQYLELESRVDVYNQRLDIVGELVDNLNDRLVHSHSAKLEWIIIWLIVTEIVVGFVPHANVVGLVPRLAQSAARLFTRGAI